MEEEGLSTTQISLVREHSVAIKPPRALWVPYELGRPLGQPNDPDFQKRVLRACLGLLDAESGPVLEDYAEEVLVEAKEDEMVGMSCPIDLPPPPIDGNELTQSLLREISQIAPWYELAVSQRGRTTVGISGLEIQDAAQLLTEYVENPDTRSPRAEMEMGPLLKLVSEDLKAFYSEAVSAQPGMSSSLAAENWLFNETALGKILWKFREEHTDDPDSYTQYLARRSLIPDRQIQAKGAPVFH